MPRKGKTENLIPNNLRSPEEVRENGRKGGIKSGESRRRAKTLRELAVAVHNAPINASIPGVQDRLAMIGLDPKKESNSALLVSALFMQAAQGDIKALEKWMELIGEKSGEESPTINIICDIPRPEQEANNAD